MKHKSLFVGTLTMLALMAASYPATAQTLTLRVESGVAIPTTDPQANRFGVGGALALKPELGLGSYFSLGPSGQVMVLPSNVSGVDTGTAWSYGGFARVKRPHDDKNTGTGFSAVSPWVDADAKYTRTDGLDRFGWAAAVGASVPTSDSRSVWVGPFARYDVVYQEDGKPGVNTNSAKTVILGLSFEFGAAQKKKPEQVVPPPQEEVVVVLAPPKKKPEPPKEPVTTTREAILNATVQFPWDSAELRPSENEALEYVLWGLSEHLKDTVKIEGHASSEGKVEHNDALSKRRAESVMNWLASHGIDRSRLSATGFGSRNPVAPNDTEAGRVLNRRVEFNVTFTLEKR